MTDLCAEDLDRVGTTATYQDWDSEDIYATQWESVTTPGQTYRAGNDRVPRGFLPWAARQNPSVCKLFLLLLWLSNGRYRLSLRIDDMVAAGGKGMSHACVVRDLATLVDGEWYRRDGRRAEDEFRFPFRVGKLPSYTTRATPVSFGGGRGRVTGGLLV